ncbi:type IV toxin-antitoxin system AbiEi family antitoxin domain-containing protein [Nocardia terpenica]|uniref:type IV toxin-antitoxin system AbiEi family antitoxin domain-containing protein n=1 Tax=Nocardia terpenica TaxID=455432 RepID=UPI001E335F2F|nr:type IV toxin-antitoxin system AbiEi family antitoxin [Nocardia terpenica]
MSGAESAGPAAGSGARRDAGVRHRRDIVRAGISDAEIRRRCTGGQWRRVRRGSYADEAAYASMNAVARHRVQVAAVLSGLAADAVVSHQSAAVLYGAPVRMAQLDRVGVTRNRRNGGRIKPGLKVHCAPVETVAVVGGLLLTTPARTIVDVARTAPLESAVVIGDALAREYGVTAADLAAELELARCRTGIGAARRAVSLLDPHSTSVGESRGRLLLHRLGLPVPRSQGEVFTADGRLLRRVPFYFGRTGVLGECTDRPDPDCREEALRANGFHLVRWTWAQLSTGEAASRLRHALIHARYDPPLGYIRQVPLPEPKRLMLRPLR